MFPFQWSRAIGLCLLMVGCAGCASGAVPAAGSANGSLRGSVAGAPATDDSGQKAERDHVNVAFGTVSGGLAFLSVAVAEGLFKPYGLTVSPTYAQGLASMTSLLAGESQFAMTEAVGTFTSVTGGAHVKLIGAWDRFNPYGIAVRSNIGSAADLKSKSIMIGKVGDPSDVSARLGLKSLGLTLGTDVQAVEGGNTPQRIAALSSGQVAAAIVDADNFSNVTKNDPNVKLLVSLKDQKIPWLTSSTVVADEFAKANPGTVFAFMSERVGPVLLIQ